MKITGFLRPGAALFVGLVCLVGFSPAAVYAQELRWHRIFGVPEAFNIVGVGTGRVTGGAPWTTTSGFAQVNLKNGNTTFKVRGLVLAVGGNSTAGIAGLDIGTPAGVTVVKGTLVCSVSGSGNEGNSLLIDTGSVPLSDQGNASFSGTLEPLPAACGTGDVAFLIRIVEPKDFADLWIAAGGVLTVDSD